MVWRQRTWLRWAIGVIVLVPVVYVSSCSLRANRMQHAFDTIHAGSTKQQVVDALGDPSVTEGSSGPPFRRYTTTLCEGVCVERFWYENRMGLDIEAWSIAFDANGTVIETSHLTLP